MKTPSLVASIVTAAGIIAGLSSPGFAGQKISLSGYNLQSVQGADALLGD